MHTTGLVVTKVVAAGANTPGAAVVVRAAPGGGTAPHWQRRSANPIGHTARLNWGSRDRQGTNMAHHLTDHRERAAAPPLS
jgi:hypothetical protein